MWRHSTESLRRLHLVSYPDPTGDYIHPHLALVVFKASISLGTKGLVPRLRQHQHRGEELGNMQCLTQQAGQTISGINKGYEV